jgi:DNA-binding NtrC family response regulator
MAREAAARDAEGEATTRAERHEHHLERASAHHALHAARLARPAAVGIYAAQSRAAYDGLERLAKAQAPAVVVARSGVDPVPFLARAHLAGARKNAPFVLVDCTAAREHDIDRWRDPVSSPLALADGGVLVLLDAAALPIDLQRLVGQALAERRAPWPRGDSLDIVLVLTTIEAPRALADAGRLDPLLSSRAGDAIDDPVRIPGIVDRPEDIRALVTDRLAREGLRVRGAPMGIDDGGFALLVDHPFEAEDAELAAIVQRLVAHALAGGRDVVRERDVRAVLSQLVDEDGPVIPTKPTPRGTGT